LKNSSTNLTDFNDALDDVLDEMFAYVRHNLEGIDEFATKSPVRFPFRKRSEHIWRVLQWAKRLSDEGNRGVNEIDKESLLIAAVFHDSGYALSHNGAEHAKNSAIIFDRYAAETGVIRSRFNEKHDFITYLIKNHSNKLMLTSGNTPLEHVLLMEADLLDETGAMSIVWDCMAEGAKADQSFVNAYTAIKSFSADTLNENPMVTVRAREYWAEKQKLLKLFLEHLAFDLNIN